MLIAGILTDKFLPNIFTVNWVRTFWYLIAFVPVGYPVLKEAFHEMAHKDFFNEFTLMSIATIGAFLIGEYPEAVAVMLFYFIGELLQDTALDSAKDNIKALLEVRPQTANVLRGKKWQTVAPDTVGIGETIQVLAGEKIPLDGIMLSDRGSFNTSALTGESVPKTIKCGKPALAGMLNEGNVVEIKVTKIFSDSSIAKILDMVQNATERKAKTELLIRKLAKIYAPIVFGLAVLITFLPYFFVSDYLLREWLYRGLIFLVISCPCALVISIPLGYFAGIGAASRNGILFKGANFMEMMTKINTVVMDKTGTLTKGVFCVQKIYSVDNENDTFAAKVAAIESKSTHPIAKAISEYAEKLPKKFDAENVTEIAGHGLQGSIGKDEFWVGNLKLLQKHNIAVPAEVENIVESVVLVAVNQQFAGYIIVADEEKEDAKLAINRLKELGIKNVVMLSGDKTSIVAKTANSLNINQFYGDLLPEHKVEKIENLKKSPENVIAFAGDGINDAPALALSDVGIAMGGMGSDAAIEIADVVIQTDQPTKIATAINISKSTHSIINQNLIFALAVKLAVLVLGATGVASMWAAVFADVGVALLCVFNAVRILKKKF
jgi:Cd2+/Zn2+-exporting ATPase